jgi:hypothetical protein
MSNKNYIAFAKGLIYFFAISHIFSYIISTIQTLFIIKEIKKAQNASKKGSVKNDPNKKIL